MGEEWAAAAVNPWERRKARKSKGALSQVLRGAQALHSGRVCVCVCVCVCPRTLDVLQQPFPPNLEGLVKALRWLLPSALSHTSPGQEQTIPLPSLAAPKPWKPKLTD